MRYSHSHTISLLSTITILTIVNLSLTISSESSPNCKSWIVQSVPTDMPHLRRVPGVLSTANVFRWLAGNASHRLDVIAQYWQLEASRKNPSSGDYGYSERDMKRFGASRGSRVYDSIAKAADRNVSIRLLSHSGVFPDFTREPSELAKGRPNVKNVTLLLGQWWGSGIVHAKVWISDRRDVYIGSANNDWKSLTQVKEVGIYLAGCPSIARKVETYFDNLWVLAFLNSSTMTRNISDHQWQIDRKVPCWSHFIETDKRCRYPFPPPVKIPHVLGYPLLSDPIMFDLPIETLGGGNSSLKPLPSYLSFAPPELSFGRYQTDEQGWIDTIKSVGYRETLRISTMDWLGQSEFAKQTVYWSSLSSAISEVVYGKQAKVQVLVSRWSHFINNTDEYLKSLLYTNVLCSSSSYNGCKGKVEIKYYTIPGSNSTGPAISNGKKTGNSYPGFTRVNHGKYAVSDSRAHIGTSNLVWDYFYTTAGVSFGTYNRAIVSQLQKVFEADWNSPYATPVAELWKDAIL